MPRRVCRCTFWPAVTERFSSNRFPTEEIPMADTDAGLIQQLESVSTSGGDKEFIRPDATVKDLTLRPYAAGTQLQLEQMRVVLKEKLAKLLADTPNEQARLNLSGYYYIGM